MNNMNNVPLLSKEKLMEIYDYLNERLKENQIKLEITIYGGSIMTMIYDHRPATRDIDCVFNESNSKLVQSILDMTKFTFNLPENWFNEEIKEPLQSILKEDKET